MPDGHATWLDLPPHHRKDIVRLGFLSAVAFAYTLAMCILAQPIPSRSLHAHVTLPAAGTPRSALLEALLVEPAPRPPLRAAAPPRLASRTPVVALRAVAVAGTEPLGMQRSTERRGNVFGRFFRTVWRTVQ